jgi:photosynthesis system II assembly factor YCF48-like protein
MTPRDDDKAMDGLLRRSLARDAAAGDTCPEPDILAAYSERSLDDEEMARYELHFSLCARCREQLAAIFRAGTVMENPVEQELMDVAPTKGAPQVMAVSSIAGAHQPKKLARHGKLDWRWLAPMAAAILLAVFLYGRSVFRFEKTLTSEKQVAMSKQDAIPPAGSMDEQLAAGKHAPAPPAQSLSRAKGAGTTQPKASLVPPELPRVAKNSPSALPPMNDEAARLSAQRSKYGSSDTLRKRPEAATGTAMNQAAPAEADSLSAEKKNADAASAPSSPDTAAAPGVGTSTQSKAKPGTRAAGAVASSATPKAETSGVTNSRIQKQAPTGAYAGADATVMSPALVMQTAWLVIQAPDTEVQYRIANVGVVERTDDGGATWRRQRVKAREEILAGAAPSENVCWLVGRGGIVLMTNDGKNWKQIPSAASVDLVAVTAADATSASVTAADGRKFSTQNGGVTWQLMK